MLDHPGWGLFTEAVDRVILARRMGMFHEGLDSLDSLMRLVRTRGEVGGLMLCKEIPRVMLTDIEADLAAILREEGS